MKTGMMNPHRLLTLTVLTGMTLAALTLLRPAPAEAGLVVRARIGSVNVAVSSDAPRGVIVQTGPRSYRCDPRVRPPRPLHGRHVWISGHYEKVWKRHARARRHGHFHEVWVPGHWERF